MPISIKYPSEGLPYFAAIPYYLWGDIDYNSYGDCESPLDKNWTCLAVTNRVNKKKHFDIVVSKDRTTLMIEGDDESIAKIKEFFSDKPDPQGMKRVSVVNYCFEHESVKKFSIGHSFWGSWKWVGTEATEFTYVGRWLMLDAMRKSNHGAWLALSWHNETPFKSQREALSQHLIDVCSENIFENSVAMENLTEPNADEWEDELINFYKSILTKFDCHDDPLML